MTQVAVGIIGVGYAAEFQVQVLRSSLAGRARVVAVAAGRAETASAFARRHGIPASYRGYDELLANPAVEVVCVCVPTGLHAEVVVAALRAGKHVICEKPLTGAFGLPPRQDESGRARSELERALSSVDEIEEAAAQSGRLVMYAENWVYAPAMTRTKQLLESSRGSILDIRAEESHSGSHAVKSRRRASAGGGALLTLGAHPIAAAIHLKDHESSLTGRRIRVEAVLAEVAALHESEASRRASAHEWLEADWHDVETWANIVLSFSDGSRAVVTASFAMLGGARNSFEIYTTNAAFRAKITSNNVLETYSPHDQAFAEHVRHEKIETPLGWTSTDVDGAWQRGYPQEMEDFIASVEEGRQPVSGLDLAREVVQVVYSGYVSAEEGRRVQIDRRET